MDQVNNYDEEPEVNPDGFFNDLTSTNACSVRVAVRVRPLIGRELKEGGAAGARTCMEVTDRDTKLIIGEKQFTFDRVFASDSEQREVFDVCSRNLVLGCFAGYNATILAYGQTGSGKTHTMGTASTSGLDDEAIGIVPRVFRFIFEELDRKRRQYTMSEFTIKISFLELYNEELHDLLDQSGPVDRVTGKSMKELVIKEKNGTIYIQGLKEEMVNNKEQCLELLNKGISMRTTSATLMNEGSSRSHAIFTISIEQRIVKELDESIPVDSKTGLPGQQEELISAKFHFVDLAGSERIKRTGATGQLLKEGISINKGLLCLGNVISALTDESKKEKHIPYRDSKLTRILQDSLGGNSRTTMIACVSPAESNYEESLNSIKYASRARNIKNKAVVNRDPNSLLIDSLRQQISKLQGEINEYQRVLKDNGVPVPDNFQDSVQKRIDEQRKGGSNNRPPPVQQSDESNLFGGSINISELKDVKVKLYRKEQALKECQDQLQQLLERMAVRDREVTELTHERDSLRLKNEIMNEHLQKSGIQIDTDRGDQLSLVEEYAQKLDKLQKELDRKNQEIAEQGKKIGALQKDKQRDDQLLSQKVEDINKLKGQLKRYQESGVNSSPQSAQKSKPEGKFKLNIQNVTGASQAGVGNEAKKLSLAIDAEGLNKKIIDSLSMQLDSIFSGNMFSQDDETQALATGLKSPRRLSRTPAIDDPFAQHPPQSSDDEQILTGGVPEVEDPLSANNAAQILEEKEKILNSFKNSVQQMQSELVVLMEHKYETQIQTIEKDLRVMENDKQATLKKTTDTKQIQVIEQQYKQKMDDLAKQLHNFKEKEKQQETVSKQITQRESKIKNLEDDINKMKKSKESMEKLMKTEVEKFSKFKSQASKELTNAIKAKSEKEKEVVKLRHDLKKTDQIAQQKMAELRGMQKKIYEERMRKEMEKQEDYEKKGIDIDRIKQWITDNTDRMMQHQELKDAMEKHNGEKQRIEDEMFQEGDKLNLLIIDKDRKELEKQSLELSATDGDEVNEGRIIELEEEIYQVTLQIQNLTETLESLEETYEFHSKQLNRLNEEAIALATDTIEPLKFAGLQSVDAARVTLQTFFSVMLDVNIYKRDLELKCIESDERILEMEAEISLLNRRMDDISTRTNSTHTSMMMTNDGKSAIIQANKEDTIKKIMNNMEGYVDQRELKGLNLTPVEQNSLTKLSLSKIVTNMKTQLEEEKKKNHNLCLKLEQAIKDKEALKLKFDNLKKKTTDDAIASDPKLYQAQQSITQAPENQKAAPLSLAQARANRRQNATAPRSGATPSVDLPTSEASGKYKSRNAQKSGLEETTSEAKVSRFTSGGTQSGKFLAKKPQLVNKKQSRSHSREDESRPASSKMPNFMKGTKSNTGNAPPNLTKKQPQLKSKAEEIQVLNQQTASNEGGQLKVAPSLRDRRNQRKLGHNEEGMQMVSDEIDKIKEETQMITSNVQHDERRQARARAFSKKIAQDRGISANSGSQQRNETPEGVGAGRLGDIQDYGEDEESPIREESAGQDTSYGQEDEQPQSYQQVQNQVAGINRWSHEELSFVDSYGQGLIACECYLGKIMLIFDDFTIREINLESMEELQPKNILSINGIPSNGEKAIDFAIDKEIGAIAIASSNFVYLFDSAYNYQSVIELVNIVKIEFCQMINIILQVKDGDGFVFVAYQITDGQELGMFECQSEGLPVEMRSDNNFIYLAYGNRLVKLQIPDFTTIFVYETEHVDSIIDFALSPQTIVTTSLDKSMRVHSITNGEQIMNSLDDLECDHLETCDDYILSRCYDGNSVVVFRFYQGKLDLEYAEDIDMSEMREQMGTITDFKMKGKIVTKFSSTSANYDIVLMVSVIESGILINCLKHKPLSEN